jgi:hypothetical protein
MMHTTRTSTTKYLKIKFKHVGGAGSSTTDVLAIFILAGVVSPFFLLATGPPGGRAGTHSSGFNYSIVLVTKSKSHNFGSSDTYSKANKSENTIQIQDASTSPEFTILYNSEYTSL